MLRNDVVDRTLDRFKSSGFCRLGAVIDPRACARTLDLLHEKRRVSADLFMDEAEYRANPVHKGVNPRPGRNITEQLDLTFVESNPVVKAVLERLLGSGYTTLMKKVVAAVPSTHMPAWVQEATRQLPVANLGAFVKPQFRDVTYFHGIDFHQDIIDYPERAADFVTLYVYLDDVTAGDSPLYVLPGSHRLGATLFPHDLMVAEGEWTYSDRVGHTLSLQHEMLEGNVGSAYVWHPCILHGTQPSNVRAEKLGSRMSLRYLMTKSSSAESLIDEVNAGIEGPLSLPRTRVDLDEWGQPIIRGNIINDKDRGQ